MHENKAKHSGTLLIASDRDLSYIWYLDSGSSKHMTGNTNLFSKIAKANYGQVTIGEAKSYKIEGVGEISFKTKTTKIEKMSEVYYVPELQSNLLSIGHLMRKDFDIHFVDNLCTMKKKSQIIANIGLSSNNLFPLKLDVLKTTCYLTFKEEVFKLWHD